MEQTIKITTNGTTRRIPADEPLFLLRGQDQFAAAVVLHWADLVEAGGGDPDIVQGARAHADKMASWAVKKVPDLPKPESMFIAVPERTLPGGIFVPAFQVSKYLCSKGDDGRIVLSASAAPWVEINYHDTVAACEAIDTLLLRETQALSIALDIASQDINWTGGKVGEGKVFQGLHKGTVDEPQDGEFESTDPEERRWHQLSNGEIIFDFAGNAFTWIFDDIQGDEKGIVKGKVLAESPSLAAAPFPSMQKGMGWRPEGPANWSGRALLRGGCWGSHDVAGVFYLSVVWPGGERDGISFRCTK
jgi:hypothetical protein